MRLETFVETIGRTAVVFVWLIGGLRLLGKRQLGQLNVYDLAMIMAVANAVQNAMTTGSGIITVGLTCAGSLILFGLLTTRLFGHFPTLEDRVVGSPTILVSGGRLIPEHLRREHVTEDQLMAALRGHGIGALKEAKLVVLEVDGSFSVAPAAAPSHPTSSAGEAAG